MSIPHPLSGAFATLWAGCEQIQGFCPFYSLLGLSPFLHKSTHSMYHGGKEPLLHPSLSCSRAGSFHWERESTRDALLILSDKKEDNPPKVIRRDSKNPSIQGLVGIFGCSVLGPRECQPPPHAGCGAEGSQVEASHQCQCQTYAVPPHEANPCSGPAQHVPMGMVLPSAEMLLQPILYLSFSATCALRRGTQSWA